MLNLLSLKTKLILGFLAMAALVGLVSGLNFYFEKRVNKEYGDVTNLILPNVNNIMKLRLGSIRTARTLAQAGMSLQAGRVDAELTKSLADSKALYDGARADYLKTDWFPGEEAVFKRADAAWSKAIPVVEKLAGLAANGDGSSYPLFERIYREDFLALNAEAQKGFDDLMTFEDQVAKENTEEALGWGSFGANVSAGLAGGGVFLAVLLGWVIATNLSRSLAQILGRVEDSSAQVAAAAQQIASSSTELSESSVEQAAAIQETAASVDEVSAMIKKNAENATHSMRNSQESKGVATEGSGQVESMVQSIGAIAEANERIMRQVEEGNREIAEIVKVINDIGSKTKVINDIVFQTKLLSFNASVEAARAGEHGKGFAVVAEEVGNLAQMSGNAAKEITEMLDASVKKVEGIVARTKESVAGLIADAKGKVSDGTDVAKLCGDALQKIVGSVSSVDQLVSEIAHASREQATGMGEITKAMAQLDQVTSQNSAVSQSCASASEQLSGQAQAMKGLVGELNALLHGASRGGVAIVAPAASGQTKAAGAGGAKVIPLARPGRSELRAKKAAGGELPTASDPRFEDV